MSITNVSDASPPIVSHILSYDDGSDGDDEFTFSEIPVCPEDLEPVVNDGMVYAEAPAPSPLCPKRSLLGHELCFGELLTVSNIVDRNKSSDENEVKIPTCKQWVQELKNRTWSNTCLDCASSSIQYVGGIPHQYERRKKDHAILLALIKKNNAVFSECITKVLSNDSGYVAKAVVHDKSYVCSRGDLHSDLASLISLLDFLEDALFLDEDYRCRDYLKVIVCGDYGDRGVNDVELYILLLLWRLENRSSVFLIRGNHEKISMLQSFSEDALWISLHSKLFEDCFKSFPLAVCIASEAEHSEYVFFGHGLFALTDLAPLLDGDESHLFLSETSLLSLRFLRMLSENTPQKQILEHLNALSPALKSTQSYYWGDPGDGKNLPGGGHKVCSLSAEDIQGYAKIAGDKSPLKFFVWGHQHIFLETIVHHEKKGKKVIGVSLAAGTVGGSLKKMIGFQNIQGLFFQVAPKVRDWTKQTLICDPGEGWEAHTILSDVRVSIFTPIT